jgi:hypothetical protein
LGLDRGFLPENRFLYRLGRLVPPAALPSVIGGPGSDFIGSATERGSGTR